MKFESTARCFKVSFGISAQSTLKEIDVSCIKAQCHDRHSYRGGLMNACFCLIQSHLDNLSSAFRVKNN